MTSFQNNHAEKLDDPEFQKGDLVTFNAFMGEVIPAKVVSFLGVDNVAGLAKYRLEGAKAPLLTITTGRSIVESKHFVQPSKFVW